MNWLYGKRHAPPKEDALPPPQSGFAQYFYVLKTHFWKFVKLSLLLVAFSIPVITLPAALCGVNRVCIRLIRDGNCFLWDDFWGEFRSSFLKSVSFGFLFGAGFAASYYLLSLGISNGQSIYGVLFLSLGICSLLISALLGSWTFVLTAMLPLKSADILKNARALAGLEGKRNLVILSILAASTAFTLLLFPISLAPALFFLPSAAQFSLCFIVNSAVQERIIAPFEASNRAKSELP